MPDAAGTGTGDVDDHSNRAPHACERLAAADHAFDGLSDPSPVFLHLLPGDLDPLTGIVGRSLGSELFFAPGPAVHGQSGLENLYQSTFMVG